MITRIFHPQAQLGEKTTLLSEARLKEQSFVERVSFRTVWVCVLCLRVGWCVLLYWVQENNKSLRSAFP